MQQPVGLISRGIYGEIIPPPFHYGINPEKAIDDLATAVKNSTGEELHRPTRGKSRIGLERLAALYTHQRRLSQALAGEMENDPQAKALHLLLENCEPLSLRPLFLDELHHLSFVPVMQRGEGSSWYVGVQGRGRFHQFTADSIADAYAIAQGIYNKWVEEEEKDWHRQMGKVMEQLTPDAHTLFWEVNLSSQKKADVAPEYRLERWGGHGQYALWLPNKQFFSFSAHTLPMAALYTKAMLLQKKDLVLPPITPAQLHETLKQVLPEINQSGTAMFVCGEIVVNVQPERITLHKRGAKTEQIGFLQGKRDGSIALYLQDASKRSPKLKTSLSLPAEWSQGDRLRTYVLWAFYSLL